MTYDEAIYYLYQLERFGIKFGLKNIKQLLSLLNNPQDSFKTIHVAGTNGKGSTAAFIASILKEAGFRVGLYTSPHLVNFCERIQVDNIFITKRKLASIMKRLIPLIKKISRTPHYGHPTYFEVSTALAFEYFRDKKVDFACIEVGMGGRLDATNVIKPEISVITNIALEHTSELGKGEGRIAFEKAGIIKKNGVLLCGVTEKVPLGVIKNICLKKKSKMYLAGKDFRGKFISRDNLKAQKFSYRSTWRDRPSLKVKFLGKHQIHNASIALAAIDVLKTHNGVHINSRDIKKGLKNAKWPGRFEIVNKRPLILLDGAHNPKAMANLVKGLKDYFPGRKIYFILGVLKDKDIVELVKQIIPLAESIIVTAPRSERACSPEKLKNVIMGLGKKAKPVPGIAEALRKTSKDIASDEIICVTGSLYTVGEARGILLSKNRNHW